MDSETELCLNRAEDEFLLAQKDMSISQDDKLKFQLGIPLSKTFFHSVISHAYYSIFYSAKAYLLSKGIKTNPPSEHQKTYNSFKLFIKNGMLNKELLIIYADELTKAEALLHIFKKEKKKRGNFTYNIKSEANVPYAQESIDNAKKFVSSLKSIIH